MRIHQLSEPTVPLRGAPGWEVSVGKLPPGPVEVLVGGRPSPEALELCERALVIPYAGLPQKTRTLLLERFPALPVYALHHNAAAVAELALALLLAAARSLLRADRALRRFDWRMRYAPDPSLRLAGGRALLLGGGAIGGRLRTLLTALGMQVDTLTRRGPLTLADLDRLLPRATCVLGALPSTPETRGLLDARRLALLPDGAVLVNVGRGDLCDEEALYEALASGRLRAGLDVWFQYPEDEPGRVGTRPSRFPFDQLSNVVLSPHRGGHGQHVEEARREVLQAVLGCLARGEEPPGRVDVAAGY